MFHVPSKYFTSDPIDFHPPPIRNEARLYNAGSRYIAKYVSIIMKIEVIYWNTLYVTRHFGNKNRREILKVLEQQCNSKPKSSDCIHECNCGFCITSDHPSVFTSFFVHSDFTLIIRDSAFTILLKIKSTKFCDSLLLFHVRSKTLASQLAAQLSYVFAVRHATVTNCGCW